MPTIQELKKYYELTEKEIVVYGDQVIDDFTAGIIKSERPIAIILGGQPGAGKSELITAAQKLTGKNVVICNADDYRDYHPKSDEIKKLHEEAYPEITVAYSQPWNMRLKQHCEEKHYNYIMETTFSSGQVMNETLAAIKDKGYDVYIMVLSVNKQLSFLGTRLRYEAMKATDGYGRLVDKVIHDKKYEQVAETLQIVQKAKLYDKLFIYGRAGRQKIKGMHNGLVLISENGANPAANYLAERDKEWSDNDTRYFNNDILYLMRKMIGRKVAHDELLNLLDMFNVGLTPSL